VELVQAEHRSLSIDEFDARFDRARPRVRAVARSILGQDSSDVDGAHPSGSSWSVSATLTLTGQPGAGRKLTGTLSIVTDGGTTVGTGSLVVDALTNQPDLRTETRSRGPDPNVPRSG
jgi:hypothetical protein